MSKRDLYDDSQQPTHSFGRAPSENTSDSFSDLFSSVDPSEFEFEEDENAYYHNPHRLSQVDPSQPVSLEYGIHQIIAKADGYKSLTQYLRVGQESAGVDVQLDKVDSDSEESTGSTQSSSSAGSSSTGTASGSTSATTDTTTTYYRVHIDAPENVEVYLDGNYVGISPCSFKKTSGSHVITLRKSGYETRSYTVQVDDEQKDVSYSFVDLTVSSQTSK